MKKLIFSLIFTASFLISNAQNVGIGTTNPDPSAMLEISSNSKGLLIPRAERASVTSPAKGLLIFQNSDASFYYHNGFNWIKLSSDGIVDFDGDTKMTAIDALLGDTINIDVNGKLHSSFIANSNDDVLLDIHSKGQSTFIGEESGQNNTGIFNTAVGSFALNKNTFATSNSAFGANALKENADGFSNVAFGYNSLSKNVSGNNLVAVGASALGSNLGKFNTAVGASAMTSNVDGENNTAIGYASLPLNTDGNYNVVLGDKAMFDNITGSFNTAIGHVSLNKNTTQSNLVAIGDSSLYSNTSGEGNTAIGSRSLKSNTTGIFNTALGNDALRDNLNGERNTAVGYNTLRDLSSGKQNTVMGSNTASINNGNDNVIVGYSASLLNSTGNSNTVLGSEAGTFSNGSNNIFLGYQSGYNANESNRLYIENSNADKDNALIYGEFDNNTLRVNDKLGIGIASLSYPLAIKGDASNDLMIFHDNLDEGQWHLKLTGTNSLNFVETAVAENRLVLQEGGNIGIGTGNPVNRLDVEGGIAIGASYSGTEISPVNGAIIQGDVGIGIADPETNLHIKSGTTPTIKLQSDGISEESGRISLRQSNDTGIDMFYDGAVDEMVFDAYLDDASAGKIMTLNQTTRHVGIGPTSPAGNLHVSDENSASVIIEADVNNTNESNNPQIEFRQDGGLTLTRVGFDEAEFGANNFGISTNNSTKTMVFSTTGNVAIGTSDFAAGHALSVNGKIATEEVRVQLQADWPDYVFDRKYDLMSIEELEKSIEKNKHLPGIPSAKQVQNNGIRLGEMQTLTMEKIEELTLYIIDLNKKIEMLANDNKHLKEELNAIKNTNKE